MGNVLLNEENEGIRWCAEVELKMQQLRASGWGWGCESREETSKEPEVNHRRATHPVHSGWTRTSISVICFSLDSLLGLFVFSK